MKRKYCAAWLIAVGLLFIGCSLRDNWSRAAVADIDTVEIISVTGEKQEALSEEEYIFTESENETIIPNPMYFKDIVYESESYNSQLLNEVWLKSYYNSKEELWVDVHIGDKKDSVIIGPFEEKLTVKDDTPVLGNIVSFDVEEGRLKAKFALGLLFES